MDETVAALAPSDPTWNPPDTGTASSILSAAAPPAAPPPVEPVQQDFTPQIPSETAPNNPDIERQFHESNLRRVLDKVGSILGGDQTLHVKKDTDGNITVTHDPSTSGEKWGRIAATALGGAAQGLANSQGPGGPARAAAAGIGFGLQQPQQRQQEADQQATAEQQRQTANANNAITHQRLYMGTLQAQDIKTRLTSEQSGLLNTYRDELLASPNAKDYGTISGPDDLMRVASQNQDFLKQHMNLQLKVVPVPNGKGGVELHAVATDPGDDAQPAPKGAYLFTLDSDPKTGEPILGTTPVSAGSRKVGELRGANQAQLEKFMTAKNNYQKSLDDKNKAEKDRIPTTAAAAIAQAALTTDPDEKKRLLDAVPRMQAAEEALKRAGRSSMTLNAGTVPGGTQIGDLIQPGGKFGAGTVDGTIAEKLAHHQMTLDEIPKRYGKGVPTPQEYTAAAEAVSQRDYGLPYSPTMIKQEEKFFDNIKSQGVLDGIDKLVGVGGSPGYLDTVVNLAQRAGVGQFAPLQEMKRAVKTKLGDSAMKDFNAALAEVQRSLPTLIGNPIIGGSDSDLKQKNAEKAFGQDITLDNLRSNAATFKGMLLGSRDSLTRNNRFLQDRYGLKGPAANTSSAPAAAPGADTSQAARQPGAAPAANAVPAGKVPAYDDKSGKLVGFADDKQGTNYHAF